jgi:hypothetical protein
MQVSTMQPTDAILGARVEVTRETSSQRGMRGEIIEVAPYGTVRVFLGALDLRRWFWPHDLIETSPGSVPGKEKA